MEGKTIYLMLAACHCYQLRLHKLINRPIHFADKYGPSGPSGPSVQGQVRLFHKSTKSVHALSALGFLGLGELVTVEPRSLLFYLATSKVVSP